MLVLLALVAGLSITEATGVTQFTASVIRVVTGEGVLVIEVDDPEVSITIDGRDLVITGAGPKEVRLQPGEYQVRATKDGEPVKTELVTITRGGREMVRVTQETAGSHADSNKELDDSLQAAEYAHRNESPVPQIKDAFVG